MTKEQVQQIMTWFIKKSRQIGQNWKSSGRKGPTGIGKTLEDAFGKPEDNLQRPDLKGLIELKAHDINSSSLLTLFTKAPSNPKGANHYLVSSFGYKQKNAKNKSLHVTTKITRTFSKKSNHQFQLEDDKKDKQIVLHIYSKDGKKEYPSVSWSYTTLNKALTRKIHILALLETKRRKIHNKNQFKYFEAVIIKHFTLDIFLKALDSGNAFVDLRLGTYPSGKVHDHGTGFRMFPNYLINDMTKIDPDNVKRIKL